MEDGRGGLGNSGGEGRQGAGRDAVPRRRSRCPLHSRRGGLMEKGGRGSKAWVGMQGLAAAAAAATSAPARGSGGKEWVREQRGGIEKGSLGERGEGEARCG